jgi:tetratricopeptide (TPR) repeat protein
MKQLVPASMLLAGVCLLLVFSTGCSPSLKKTWHLHRAAHYYSAGQLDRAEIEYLNVVRNDPANFLAISRLGEIYFTQGRVQMAGQFLFRASQLGTNDLAVRVHLGQLYQAAGKFKEARQEAVFVLDRQPQNPDAPVILAESSGTPAEIAAARQYLSKLPPAANQTLLQVALGILSFRQQDYPAAQAAFQRAQTLDPKCPMVWSAMGVLAEQLKNLKQAETAFKTAADLSPPRSNLRLNYANFEVQNGHLDVADAFLSENLHATPDFVPAWVLRAEIAMSEKKYDVCAACLQGALSRDPESYDAALLTGQLELSRGENLKARTQLERLAHLYPLLPRLQYLLALTCLANNDPNAAVVSLDRALTLQTNFTDASLLLAQVQMKNGKPDAAVALLRQVIDRDPSIVQAALLLADAYRAKGQPAEALVIYQQVEKAAPKNPGLPLLEGFAYREQQDNASARQAFSRALELAPGDLRVLDALVKLDLTEKQYVPAIQLLETALTNNPHPYDLYLLEASVFEEQKNPGQTVAVLQKAVRLNPDSPRAHLALARHYFMDRQLPKALEEVQAVLQTTPGNLPTLLLKSEILTRNKDYAGAAAACEQMLVVDPQSSVALNNLACLYSEYLGQLDKACELAKKARSLQPLDPSTADTLGWVLFHKKDYASALALLQESVGKLPQDPAVQFHFGKACYMQGKEAAATAAFRQALKLNPSFEGHEECQQCLDLLAINLDQPAVSPAVRATLERRITQSPDDPVALERLAVIYQQAGDNDKAVRTEEAILKANPNNVKIMLDLARLYSLNNLPKAFEIAKNAYKVTPQDPDVSCLLGRLAYQSKNYKWALSLLEETAQVQPNNPTVQFDLARAAYSLGKVSEARSSFQVALAQGLAAPQAGQAKQCLELLADLEQPVLPQTAGPRSTAILQSDPENVPALMVAALALEQKSGFDAAARDYEKVLGIFPDFAPAQKKLALLYAKNPNRIQEASALALKARQSFPNDSELTKFLGVILCQQGDYQQAVNYLTLSATDRQNDPELFYYLGLAQFHLHYSAESKTSLRRALDLKLSASLASEAHKLLLQIK